MKILVTGVAGQLGHDVMNELDKRGIEGIGSDLAPSYNGAPDGTAVTVMPYEAMDITDAGNVEEVLRRTVPDAVVHCAAWTAVDKAEECPEACRAVNAGGTENIARVCGQMGIPMMYFSPEYVFDGQGERPWKPEDPKNPLDVYGMTKSEGEDAVIRYAGKYYILRIAWVFGTNGRNFIKTMLNLAKTHDTLRVVNDQIGTPTYTDGRARLVVDMMLTDRYGIYHVTNEGSYISWYDFACAIFREAGVENVRVIPVSTAEYGAAAIRPSNSRMDRSRIIEEGFEPLPDWRDALRRYIRALSGDAS